MNFEPLVDRIYEAAADPDLWPLVLHDLGRTVDGAGGILLTRRKDEWLGWRVSAELEPRTNAYLTSTDAVRSQATPRLLAANRAGFVTEQELFTEEEFLADPMMTAWGTPNGLHHAAATAIHVPTGDLVVLQVQRRVGKPALARDELRLERLRAAAEALALIGLPAAILNASGQVLAANALIQSMRSHLVWLPHDRITLSDPGAAALLRQSIAHIGDPAATSVRSFPVRGALVDDPVVIHLIPVTGEAREVFGGGFGVLVVTAVSAPAAPAVALIRPHFGRGTGGQQRC
jgi:hypothetical protein